MSKGFCSWDLLNSNVLSRLWSHHLWARVICRTGAKKLPVRSRVLECQRLRKLSLQTALLDGLWHCLLGYDDTQFQIDGDFTIRDNLWQFGFENRYDILDVFSVHFNCSTPLHFRNTRYNMIPHPPTLWEGVSHFMKGTKSERPAERGKKHKRADKTWQALQAHLWIFDVYVYTYIYIYTYTSTAQECH
jgi:hypothetical protein